jgi:hypothetical protein
VRAELGFCSVSMVLNPVHPAFQRPKNIN